MTEIIHDVHSDGARVQVYRVTDGYRYRLLGADNPRGDEDFSVSDDLPAYSDAGIALRDGLTHASAYPEINSLAAADVYLSDGNPRGLVTDLLEEAETFYRGPFAQIVIGGEVIYESRHCHDPGAADRLLTDAQSVYAKALESQGMSPAAALEQAQKDVEQDERSPGD